MRPRAFTLLGLGHWRQAEPSAALDRLRDGFAADLAAAYQHTAGPGWRWFEDVLTYCNARLPQALLGTTHEDIGLESLAWLCELLEVDGRISLIGNRGWYARGGQRATFDQQAIDACAAVSACVDAYRVSGDRRFHRWAQLCFDWFRGANPGARSMIDDQTGGCYDGLEEAGVNHNQGAESLLAWLLAQEDMLEIGWA